MAAYNDNSKFSRTFFLGEFELDVYEESQRWLMRLMRLVYKKNTEQN